MKKFKLTIITLLLIFSLTGCSSNVHVEHKDDKSDRYSMFTIVEEVGGSWYIVYHRETKVMYAVSDGQYNHGTFTLLVDADGKPLLYGDEVN